MCLSHPTTTIERASTSDREAHHQSLYHPFVRQTIPGLSRTWIETWKSGVRCVCVRVAPFVLQNRGAIHRI